MGSVSVGIALFDWITFLKENSEINYLFPAPCGLMARKGGGGGVGGKKYSCIKNGQLGVNMRSLNHSKDNRQRTDWRDNILALK